jgi:molybdopterin-synthase adenylyltransferase
MDVRVSDRIWSSLSSALLARSDVESAGLLFAESLPATSGPVLVVRDAVAFPDSAYTVRELDQLQLDPIAINRLTRPARDRGWSIITAHTHPAAARAAFSWADDRGDARLLPSFASRIPGVPHGSIVLASSGDIATRLLTDGALRDARFRVVGVRLRAWPAQSVAPGDRFHRQVLALGADGQAALQTIVVGVVGLGGTGSIVAAQLAHLGVRDLVFVDGDRVETSNLPRIVGASGEDVDTPKVKVAARYASRLGASVLAVPTALAGEPELEALRGCDVIFSCVDRHAPRAILNRLAYSADIPLIDMGTAFRVDSVGAVVGDAGRVIVTGPGRPCLACWGVLDPERLRVEALSLDDLERERGCGYIQGARVHQPSVIPFNGMVASAAVIEFLRICAGFGDGAPGPDHLAFSFVNPGSRKVTRAAVRSCAICG